MKLYDSFRSAVQSLVTNKLRSALTMLGVIIGVASVIAMVAVGNGASQQIQDRILSLGSNLITVQAAQLSDQGLRGAGAQSQNLTLDDMRSLQDELGPEAVQVGATEPARMRALAHHELAAAADDAHAARAFHALDPPREQLGAIPELTIERSVEEDAHARRPARSSARASP